MTASGAATQPGAVPGTSSSATPGAASASANAPAAGTVTLITGDRVTVTRNGSRPLVHVEPGPGRTKVAFSMQIDRESIEVMPSDVVELVARDQLDRARVSAGSRSWQLFRDGALVEEVFDQQAQFPDPFQVPPGPATYRLEAEIEPPTTALELSTRVTAAWTFRSQRPAEAVRKLLPLPVVRFTPALDDHDVAGPVHLLPAIVERPAGSPRPPIARVDVSASFDDGATWTPIPAITVGERWLGVVVAPRQATHISLRASARDVQGRQVEQTIVRAYGVGATAP